MIKEEYKHSKLTGRIIDCAMEVHTRLGSGFHEVIYQRALQIEMELAGIKFKREFEMRVFYRDLFIGTRRVVSLMFFKNEKHLDSSGALERAVKKILNIEQFADSRDFQYLYVLHCDAPRAIVLCENLYFLKMPEKPKEKQCGVMVCRRAKY